MQTSRSRAPGAGSAIQVRGLRKSYGGAAAVDGIDLDVCSGRVFALLGPNGAGKTTTIEILTGHRRRDAGTVAVLGEDPARAGRPWRARIGIVAQSGAEAGELTAGELLRHFARYYPNPRHPDEVLAAVGLLDRAGTRLRELSGGQRRRVDVALGIVGSPELIFLDEPTTGFDPEARRAFWSLITSLAGDGTTTVLTTHYLDEAEALADELAVIRGGQVVACGTPAQLGGRAAAPAAVSWHAAGGPRTELTDTPTRLVAQLAARFDGEIPGLTVTRPSLEDVYLRLIGACAS
jgi:ABC-2 type transport system ATP-binding protein